MSIEATGVMPRLESGEARRLRGVDSPYLDMTASMPLDKRINYRLNRISHRWSTLVGSMARTKYRLNLAELKILSVIARYQPVSPSELIERTSSDSPKVARVVGRLTAEGLIERLPDEHDGRRAVLLVTAKGQKVNADIDRFANQVEERAMSGLNVGEQKALHVILDKIEAVLHRELGGTDWLAIRAAEDADASEASPPKPSMTKRSLAKPVKTSRAKASDQGARR